MVGLGVEANIIPCPIFLTSLADVKKKKDREFDNERFGNMDMMLHRIWGFVRQNPDKLNQLAATCGSILESETHANGEHSSPIETGPHDGDVIQKEDVANRPMPSPPGLEYPPPHISPTSFDAPPIHPSQMTYSEVFSHITNNSTIKLSLTY